MFGLELEFKCKGCSKEQIQEVSGTPIYEINKVKDIDYVPLKCLNCNKVHFVATNFVVVNSMSEEDIELAYRSKIIELFGETDDYDKNRKYMDGKLNFITKDKITISINEVTHKKQVGIVMY